MLVDFLPHKHPSTERQAAKEPAASPHVATRDRYASSAGELSAFSKTRAAFVAHLSETDCHAHFAFATHGVSRPCAPHNNCASSKAAIPEAPSTLTAVASRSGAHTGLSKVFP